MKLTARPTAYRGVTFRSRLEATWAAFFDLAGWRWEYEPVDAEGWVPDFFLFGHEGPLPVEVKPIDLGAATRESLLAAPELEKVRQSGVMALVLGLGIFPNDKYVGLHPAVLGYLLNFPTQYVNTPTASVKRVEINSRVIGDEKRLDVFPVAGDARYFFSPNRIGEMLYFGDAFSELAPLWGAAKTATQWKGQR